MVGDFELVILIIKIFAGFFVFIGAVVFIYGIKSLIDSKTRIFSDDEGNYNYSSSITLMSSLVEKRFAPWVYSRVLPRTPQSVDGDIAKVVAVIYLLLGLAISLPSLFIILHKF